MAISALFKGNSVDLNHINVVAMNFGQLHRIEGFKQGEYELKIGFKFFVQATSVFFNNLRDELIEELKDELENEFAAIENYIKLGCPRLEKMIIDNVKVLEALIQFYDFEILNSLQNAIGNDGDTKYLIYSVSQVAIDGLISIKGIAVEK